MHHFSSVPDEISHKDLNTLLSAAIKETCSLDLERQHDLSKKLHFDSAMREWAEASKVLLSLIQERSPEVIDLFSSKQAMALGALEVHLSCALQAKDVIDKDS